MKKKIQIILVISVLVLFGHQISAQTITGNTITGSTVTGEVTNAGTSLSITLTGPPTLVLNLPKNGTYITDKNLYLNFTARSANLVWYNLDNSGNITITGNTIFNATAPSHTLYLYANNSHGLAHKSITFSVNTSKFFINYSNYKNSGVSTDFNSSTFEEIQNLSGILIENPIHGKIFFNEPINLTDNLDPTDKQVDINSNINISFNRIEINTTKLPNFNKSATLYLYGLSFSNPRILKNGELCAPTICSLINYSGGTLIFNVTSFSIYSAEETPKETIPIISSRGSIISKIISLKKPFDIDVEKILVKIKQGEVKTKEIEIKNNLDKPILLKISPQIIEEYVLIKETEFLLMPKESKKIILDFIIRENVIPDIYLGKISISGEGLVEEMLTLIEVETSSVLLDVYLEIDSSTIKIAPGKEIVSQIKIFNFGSSERGDLEIEYSIRNKNNEIIYNNHETIAIQTQLNLLKKFYIPEYVKEGTYVLYVKVNYKEEFASASSTFEVSKKRIFKTKINRDLFIIIIILISLILLISLTIRYILNKRKIRDNSISENIRKRFSSFQKY